MQLSAANLLVAAQQAARQAQQPQPKAFAAALAESAKEDLFAPLDFKTAPRLVAPSQPARNIPAAPQLGANLDIRI
jgi:hypothetical protein